jgi:hypothetical protein
MFACQHAIKSAPMGSDEYRRLRAAFLTMAQQSDLPNVQARWLALAQACFSLAIDQSTGSHARKCAGDRSKSILTDFGSRVAIGLCAAQEAAPFLAEPVSAFL